MFIKQIYTNCLAHAAYYVESEGEALVIDPLRDPEPYIQMANERKAKIRYVFETHFHADFVSGHQELSGKTGAVIVFGPDAKPGYRALSAFDGEEFNLGKIRLKVIHTPGHTLESCCFLLMDESGKAHSIFTGDTLFVGDVGRPDLLSGNMDKVQLAEMLYDSITRKIKTLPDELIVYPGHGAGSACGKNIGKETVTTIGEQKRNNYALKEMSRNEFVQAVTSGLTTPPPYFFKDAALNINGSESYDKAVKKASRFLDLKEVNDELSSGSIILDTRNADDFAASYIPGSVNIGLNGQFAVWAGTVLSFNKPLVLLTDPGKEKESAERLARIGYDSVRGCIRNGIQGWKEMGGVTESISSVSLEEIEKKGEDQLILDLRNDGERVEFRIEPSMHIPLSQLNDRMNEIPKGKKICVFCAGGYRSMIGAALLKKAGLQHVINLRGGVNAYKNAYRLPHTVRIGV